MPKRFINARGSGVERLARPQVLGLVPYWGGKSLDELERETGRRNFIKLASNENPLGPSPRTLGAMRRAIGEAHLYPESAYPRLKQAIASRFKLTPRHVILGDGSDEILVLAANAFLRPGDEAVMATPSFVVFAHAVAGAGGRPVAVPLTRTLCHDLPAMARAVTRRTKLVFVCNPNNPTGTIVHRREVDQFLRRLPGHTIVVFDEAYAEFVDERSYPSTPAYVRRGLQVLTVRTFSKLYGLAGLRIGYGLGAPALVQVLERLRQPFNVNAIAYRAAVAALSDRAHVARTLRCVRTGRRWLSRELNRLGLIVVPSQANFLLVRPATWRQGDGNRLADRLLAHGVIVRAFAGAALRPYIRITVGTAAQNRVVVKALRAVLARSDDRTVKNAKQV